jgi:hypothetical protein
LAYEKKIKRKKGSALIVEPLTKHSKAKWNMDKTLFTHYHMSNLQDFLQGNLANPMSFLLHLFILNS